VGNVEAVYFATAKSAALKRTCCVVTLRRGCTDETEQRLDDARGVSDRRPGGHLGEFVADGAGQTTKHRLSDHLWAAVCRLTVDSPCAQSQNDRLIEAERTGRALVSTKTLLSIQVLRAVAALAVTIAHTQYEMRVHYEVFSMPTFGTGAAGVDLFFVISGFVMVYASEGLFGSCRSSQVFFLRRIIRIVPVYWLITTILLAFILWKYRDLANAGMSWASVITSYLFIPYPLLNGQMAPIVAVGWTLNYEMFFYLLFAAFLLFRRCTAVLSLSAFMVLYGLYGWGLYGNLIALPLSLANLASPIIIEFVFGMLIALAYRELKPLPKRAALTMMATGSAVLIATAIWDLSFISRVFIWGMPSALIVAGAVSIEPSSPGPVWRYLGFLGDISYSLYLVHGIAMTFPRYSPIKLIDPVTSPWPYCLMLVIVAVSAALVLYLVFERPVTRALKRAAPGWETPQRSVRPAAA
jgi:exopolysaccharide production protein ExoZ